MLSHFLGFLAPAVNKQVNDKERVAAALEYMHTKPLSAANRAPEAEKDPEDAHAESARPQVQEDGGARIEDDDDQDARTREEAGNDWLAEQGFDRKD